ncbi:hypothetical protein HYX13_02525 [Candidatus Woesearchaeota archaeon]|nr:hypothetical protein [Candidatus Woesearchaeota archaeon]
MKTFQQLGPQDFSLEALPDLCESTGISRDYGNNILGFVTSYELGGMRMVQAHLKEYPPITYQKRYPATTYKDVVTPQNQWRVKALDTLVDWLNAYGCEEAEMNEQGFKQVMLIAESLIYGKNKRIRTFMDQEQIRVAEEESEKKKNIFFAPSFTFLEDIVKGDKDNTISLSPAVKELLQETLASQKKDFSSLHNLRYSLDPERPFHPDSFYLCWELSGNTTRLLGISYSAEEDLFQLIHHEGKKYQQKEMLAYLQELFQKSQEESEAWSR